MVQERHESDLIDVKPNNILLNYTESPDGSLDIGDVKLSDLEDAVLLPPQAGP